MTHPEPSSPALQKQNAYHTSVVAEVAKAVAASRVVVVGMAWNPNVPRARKALDAAGVDYIYLGYGSYLGGWGKRLAIKMWSQWPTYPQVFVDGMLIGGADETQEALKDGTLTA